jgi:hypothetical protein
MKLEEFIDGIISIVGEQRWNKYVYDPLDSMITKAENKVKIYDRKMDVYVRTHVIPYLEAHVSRRW